MASRRHPAHHPLLGSHVVHRPGARRVGPLPAERALQVTIVLHPADPDAHRIRPAQVGRAHPLARPVRGRPELARRYDPGDAAVARVTAFARDHGLAVRTTSRVRHDVVVEGPAESIERAFGVELHDFEHDGGRYHAHDGAIHVPSGIANVVDGVLGLDAVPLHRPHAAAARPAKARMGRARAARARAAAGFDPGELAAHYRFPASGAAGETIALLEFAGGYDPADLAAFATQAGVPLPPVRVVPVAGGDGTTATNAPLARTRVAKIAAAWKGATSMFDVLGVAGGDLQAFIATMEVTMDVELAIGLGGGAAIDVVFAPPGADGWRRAIYAAIGESYEGDDRRGDARADGDAPRPPAAISISWGSSESTFGPMKLRLIHRALNAAEAKGVAVCCASGDHGSANAMSPGPTAAVNFPASSPAVIAIGGTRLAAIGADAAETAWKGEVLGEPVATGGGMSGFFDRPAWQAAATPGSATGTWLAAGRGAGTAGRWVPDVAADAAFESGMGIVVGGRQLVSGGTSAAAPLWAALLARIGGALGHHVGGLGPWLYEHAAAGGCIDVQGGDNDVSDGAIASYRAGPGWDACTGLGRPDGEALLAALRDPARGADVVPLATPPRRARTPRR